MRWIHEKSVIITVIVVLALFHGCKVEEFPVDPSHNTYLIEPDDGKSFVDPDSIVFIWKTEEEGVDTFKLEIAAHPDIDGNGSFSDTNTIRLNVNDTFFVWRPTALSGTFYWHVRPSKVGLRWSEIRRFSVQTRARMSVPIPIIPTNGATFTDPDSIIFIWHSSPEGGYYELQIAQDTAFDFIVVDDTLRDTMFIWSTYRSGHYSWRLRGLFGNISSEWSEVRMMHINLTYYDPVPPIPLFPESDAEIILPGSVDFIWTSVIGARRYRLQLAQTPDFFVPFLDTTIHDTCFLWDTISIVNTGTLWWRIKSLGIHDSSDWSLPLSFTLFPTLISLLNINGVQKNIVEGRWLFSAVDSLGLKIYDISDPESPTFVGGVFWFLKGIHDMAKIGNIILIPILEEGLRVIDVSTPSNPIQLATYTRIHDGKYITAQGNIAAIATASDSLFIVEISDIHRPRIYGPNAINSTVNEISISQNTLFLLTNRAVEIYDISVPSNPVIINEMNTLGTPTAIYLQFPFVFIGTSTGDLECWDISAGIPSLVDRIRTPNGSISSLGLLDSLLLLGYTHIPVLCGVTVSPDGHLTYRGCLEVNSTINDIAISNHLSFVAENAENVAILNFNPYSVLTFLPGLSFDFKKK